jgi:ABC-type multidrug transport system fused ATPase/permease subunit
MKIQGSISELIKVPSYINWKFTIVTGLLFVLLIAYFSNKIRTIKYEYENLYQLHTSSMEAIEDAKTVKFYYQIKIRILSEEERLEAEDNPDERAEIERRINELREKLEEVEAGSVVCKRHT